MGLVKLLEYFGLYGHDKAQQADQARKLYDAIVSQSRQPDFYRDMAVPDTVDGRFEMIILHGFLLMDRLRDFGKKGEALNQAIFDEMFANLDLAQREVGIGDMGVPHHIKRMMKAFYGRSVAYQQALEKKKGQDTALNEALSRNLYATAGKASKNDLKKMAAYIKQQRQYLDKLDFDFMTTGGVVFQPLKPKKKA